MEKNEFIQHWSYFCSLAERLDETKHYIDHGVCQKGDKNILIHGEVYSDIFKQIIVLSASEFEIISKALCQEKEKKVDNIKDISETILSEFPKIVDFQVSTPFWINVPLYAWKCKDGKVSGLEWWKAYNSIKHCEKSSYSCATLQNAILSLEALYIMELYLMYTLFDNMRIAYEYPCVYFKCKYLSYPTSMGEGKLPDFGDLSPGERMRKDFPDFFDNTLL